MQLLYLFGFIVAGLAVDWATFWRWDSLMAPARSSRPTYIGLLFPRVMVTIASLTLIFFAMQGGHTNQLMFFAGVAMFLLSNLYATLRSFNGE